MEVKILLQQGDHRYLIDAGTDTDGQELGRIYDLLMDDYGPPLLIGSLLAHSPGWRSVTAPADIQTFVQEKVSAKPRLAALRGGDRVVSDLHGIAGQ